MHPVKTTPDTLHPLHQPNLTIDVIDRTMEEAGLPKNVPSIVGEPPDQMLDKLQLNKSISPYILSVLRPWVKNKRVLYPGLYSTLGDEVTELLEREYPDHKATQVMRENKDLVDLCKRNYFALLAVN